MRIRLVRHGEPDFDRSAWVARDGFASALERYASSTVLVRPGRVVDDVLGPRDASRSPIAVSSELTRARRSAELLGFRTIETSPLLDESRLPHPDALPCRMPWTLALTLYRIAWLAGYRRNADGRRADLERADAAADWLASLAAVHGDVLACGHGVMHHLTRRRLVARGWSVERTSGRGYWSCTVMVRADRELRGTSIEAPDSG